MAHDMECHRVSEMLGHLSYSTTSADLQSIPRMPEPFCIDFDDSVVSEDDAELKIFCKYQKSTELLIRKLPFQRLVREIAQDFKACYLLIFCGAWYHWGSCY
ncbi:unnamed protein product [Thlaspi arvense]|uniref:Core Histone H2A/H2B/H3 domain-containing protein n=1 Tax=Thlaspi arvense TaxID=13288 RepID=A0AAU9RGZ4_THLAR|nr:unnamed protein product [Thlaspi arvense]